MNKMNFLCCFSSNDTNDTRNASSPTGTSTEEVPPPVALAQPSSLDSTRSLDATPIPETLAGNSSSQAPNTEPNINNIPTQTFTFQELRAATKKFRKDHLIGEGYFGKAYKGILGKNGPVVVIKQLNSTAFQEKNQFLAQVLILSYIRHANVVNLVGYCADDDHRLLVYEYMPRASLGYHFFDLTWQHPLDWSTRMRIAYGVALGLEYLHEKFDPPVTYRYLTTSCIILDENFNPKLLAFGLSNPGPLLEKTDQLARLMGTNGYCAPDSAETGKMRVKADVYNYGVILLELIAGRRYIGSSKPSHEQYIFNRASSNPSHEQFIVKWASSNPRQNIVNWAKPMFRDKTRHPELIDPLLKDDYPPKALNHAVAVAAMCLLENAHDRPIMADVVMAFTAIIAAGNEITISPSSSSVSPSVDQMSTSE
ncbi:hypothetical protein LUZ61_008577 [Rhynchospora tenuis]|uniref:Protein kinase domain-containing protein n=1 Tax=Rhynchospora tenuis TaxID=198213 RepID=A0AAD5ZVT2_9POAL|nr:hypothetical protein LUZ61_008577 [Rhynchospora tenuis]